MVENVSPALVNLQWFAEDTQAAESKPQADVGAAPSLDKGNSGTVPEWMSDLPDPLKSSKSLQRYADKATIAKSYLELEGKLSKSTVVPGKDAKPEDWEAFYSRAGRPKSAADYALEVPEGFQAPEAFIGRLRETLHQAGLSQAQAARIFGFVAGEATGSERAEAEARAQAFNAGQEALKKQWGFEYDANIEHARRFIERTGGDDAIKHLEELGIANDPVLLSMLSAAGKAVGQHRIVTGDVAGKGKAKPYAYMNEGKAKPGG